MTIPATLTPRYVSPEVLGLIKPWITPKLYRLTKKRYPWCITVNFKDSGLFRRVYSTTHPNEIEIDRAGHIAQVRLGNRKELLRKLAKMNKEGKEWSEKDLENEFFPNKNFELVFEDLKPFRPQATIVTFKDYQLQEIESVNHKRDQESSEESSNQLNTSQEDKSSEDASLSYLNSTYARIYPKLGVSQRLVQNFYRWKFEMEAQNNMIDPADFDLQNLEFLSKNKKIEFYFIIDTSGSMEGERLVNAKQTLKILVKSLPDNSKFNVVTFNSNHTFLFKESILKTQTAIDSALDKIEALEAGGGTKMLPAFEHLSKKKIEVGCNRLVFLVTDGAIAKSSKLLEKVAEEYNRTGQRVFGVGIGNGASEDLVQGAAEAGQGSYLMIADSDDPRERLNSLLAESLSPSLIDFEIKFDPAVVVGMTPKPSKLSRVTPTKPLELQLLLNPEEFRKSGWRTLVEVSYLASDSGTRKTQSFILDLSNEPSKRLVRRNDAIFRLFAKNCLDHEEKCYRDERLQKANHSNLRLALEYEIIHPSHTSFLCVMKKRNKIASQDQKEIYDLVVPSLVEEKKDIDWGEKPYMMGHGFSATMERLERPINKTVKVKNVDPSMSMEVEGEVQTTSDWVSGKVKSESTPNLPKDQDLRWIKQKTLRDSGEIVEDFSMQQENKPKGDQFKNSSLKADDSGMISRRESSSNEATDRQNGPRVFDENSKFKNVKIDDQTRIEVIDLIAKHTFIQNSGPLKGRSLLSSLNGVKEIFTVLRASEETQQKYQVINARIGLSSDEFFTAFAYVLMRNDQKLRKKGVLLYKILSDSVKIFIQDQDTMLALYKEVEELLNS